MISAESARDLFLYQKQHNPVYARFTEALGVHSIASIDEIPLLPIEAFKYADIVAPSSELTSSGEPLIFQSSGTSGMQRSRHVVLNQEVYRTSILDGMSGFYALNDFVIWCYTPGYNENPHSSLIWMLKTLVSQDLSGLSTFLPLNTPLDPELLEQIAASGKRLMLFGAAFGLIDLAESYPVQLPEHTIIIETGGMKTHRREMSKQALKHELAKAFSLDEEDIHSEYGMTELLSQAYNEGTDWFTPVPWMHVTIRDPKNPLRLLPPGEEGKIGVIDTANRYSCPFLLTGDRGILHTDKTRFQVLGRWNTENLRGCNFLIDQD